MFEVVTLIEIINEKMLIVLNMANCSHSLLHRCMVAALKDILGRLTCNDEPTKDSSRFLYTCCI